MKDKELYKVMNKMAFPVLLSALGEMIFGVADQAIIGRTTIEGYAAVGVVANFIYLLTGTLGCISIAFVIIFGKAIGAKDYDKQNRIFSTAINLSIIIGFLFGIISVIFGRWILGGFYGLQGEVLQYAYEYFVIAGWGLGLNLLIFLFSAYFKSLQKTFISMMANIISLSVNFVIDYTLVFGKFGFPKLGVKGAAIGTIAGLLLNVVIFVFFFKKYKTVEYRVGIDTEELKNLIKVYIPILGQDFVESTLFVMVITAFVTRLDTYSIATYNLLELVISIVILPAHAYGGVAMTLASQCDTNQQKDAISKYPIVATLCAEVAVTLVGGIVLLFPEVLKVVSNDIQLISSATGMCVFAIAIQLINVIVQIYKYVLQSTEFEHWVFQYTIVVSAMGCMLIFLNVIILNMGLRGIYIGMGMMYMITVWGYMKKWKQNPKCGM